MRRVACLASVLLLGAGVALAAEGRKEIFRPVSLSGAAANGKFFISRNITAASGARVLSFLGTGTEDAEVDLNGFTLTGAPDDIVVYATGMKRLVVRNGTLVSSHVDSPVLRVTNGPDDSSVVVQDTRISGGRTGIMINETVNVMIRRNFIFDSSARGIEVISPTSAPSGFIEGNVIRGVAGSGIVVEADQFASAGLTIRDNSIECAGGGIDVDGTTAVRISANVVRAGLGGILVDASDTCVIAENRLRGAGAGSGDGISIHSSLDCQILGNVMRQHVNGIALYISDRHHIEGNVANQNTNWGIWFNDESWYNTYGGNTARGNFGPACPTGPPACGGNDFCNEGANNSSFGDNLIPGPPPC